MHGGVRRFSPASNRTLSGLNVERTSANSAKNTRMVRIVRPTRAFRCRRTLRSVSRQRLAGFALVSVSGESSTGGAAAVIGWASRRPDPWIEVRVADIDEQVDEEESDCDDDREAFDDREIVALDRLEHGLPDAGQVEDGLRENRPGQEAANLQTDDRDYWEH